MRSFRIHGLLLAFVSTLIFAQARANAGACCLPSNNCIDLPNAAQCTAQSGTWHGAGTQCCDAGIPCTNNCGACCSPNGNCQVREQSICVLGGGNYLGDQATCTPGLCLGACCANNGDCQVIAPSVCGQVGGTFLGVGATCQPGACLGACCLPGDTCSVLSRNACNDAGGEFQSIGSVCGIVACSVLWNNGPVATGPAVNCVGQQSLNQNVSECTTTAGWSADSSENNSVADDFTLSQRSILDVAVLYAYEVQVGVTQPTITAATVRIHTGQPSSPGNQVLVTKTALSSPVDATDVYRQTESAPDCNRRLQRVAVDLEGLILDPGTYWISFQMLGGPSSGPWVPPVTILGELSKPGANGLRSSAGSNFGPATSSTNGPCPPPLPPTYIDDHVFVIEGRVEPVVVCCRAPDACTLEPRTLCTQSGGIERVGFSSCDSNPCAISICCASTGQCSNVTVVDCVAGGGTPGPVNVPCGNLPDFDGDGLVNACDPDDDDDGVPDEADACPHTPAGVVVDDRSGRPLGDMNGDCVVNGADVQGFVNQILGN